MTADIYFPVYYQGVIVVVSSLTALSNNADKPSSESPQFWCYTLVF